MSLFLLLLYVALYIIMAFIVWFDKKDGKSGRESKSASTSMQMADGYEKARGQGDYEAKSFMEHFIDALQADWP